MGCRISSGHGVPCPHQFKNKIKSWRSEDRRYEGKFKIEGDVNGNG
jgi:hypothetical protein